MRIWFICCALASLARSRVVLAPNIRRAMFKVIHFFDLGCLEVARPVQVLAIAHHRRLKQLIVTTQCRVQTSQ